MGEPTGAERYLTERLQDPEYRKAWEQARRDINVDAARNFAEEYRRDGKTTAAQAIDDLLDEIELLRAENADLRSQLQPVDTEPERQHTMSGDPDAG